ncbi:MAG: transporter [Methylococcales bacterium]|jgi:hypothetical protein
MQIKRLLIVISLTLLSLFGFPAYSKENEAEVTVQSLIDSPSKDQKIVAESVYESNDKLDIRFPGSDLANYPNSAFTLPQGGFYLEVAPTYSTDDSGSYSATYLLRYGLLDRLELRLLSSGPQEQGGNNPVLGFNPLTFDVKMHLWDEVEKYYLPAVGFEIYLQTTLLGSPAFNSGTQPTLEFNFDQSLFWDIALEYNIGASRSQDSLNAAINTWGLTFQWALQHDVVEDFAVFVNGWYNSEQKGTLIVPTNNQISTSEVANVIGAGCIWTVNDKVSLFFNSGAGTNSVSPTFTSYVGFAWMPW